MTTLTKQLRVVRKQVGAPSLKTRRSVNWDDVRHALALSKEAKRRVRVYSADGFVPNSYRHRCEIQFVEVHLAAGRITSVFTDWTGAQRPRGRGNLEVVQ